MKICLVNPDFDRKKKKSGFSRFIIPVLPLGTAYLAAVLERSGHQVEVVDMFAEKLNEDQFIRRMMKNIPDIIGISCLTTVAGSTIRLCNAIRKRLAGTKIVLGNIHASIFAEDMVNDGLADFVVHREAEETLLELITKLEQGASPSGIKGITWLKNGKAYREENRVSLQNLDTLPHPAWHKYKLELYQHLPFMISRKIDTQLPILASRGCPYSCYFCSQTYTQNRFRARSIESVVDEIEHHYKVYNARVFGFNDASFPYNRESGEKFVELLAKRKLDIKWHTEARVDILNNRNYLKTLARSGLFLVQFGFESGNQEVLDRNNKKASLADARETMKMMRETDILSVGLFMIGLPGDTWKSCLETIRFARELDCDLAKFNIAIPYPGSQFWEDMRDTLEQQDTSSFSPWTSPSSGDLPWVPEGMSSRQLRILQSWAMLSFHARPKLIFRHLKKGVMTADKMFSAGSTALSTIKEALIK